VISIQQVAPDARNAGDAARNALKRALVELAPYCPRLAAELHNFRIDEKLGTVRYVPTAASPAINVGIASEYGADAKVA
jgi:hypothetical protein